jgi:hypothetical protein
MRGVSWVVLVLLFVGVACASKEPVLVTVEPERAAPPQQADPPPRERKAKPRPRPTKADREDPSGELPAASVECSRPEQFGPIQLTTEQYARRYGANITDLASLKTSKDQPVEVCHVRGEQEFLLAARCADGTAPFASVGGVAQARSGSVGGGGRCKSIIDLYKVACPEATYEVFMDMYMCPEGKQFR